MEIWQYIEVLRRPGKTWFFSKDNLEEKLSILAMIADEGYPSLIYRLIDLLKDNNKEIRKATCETIIHLFKKISSKKGFYDTLKHCNISESDIDFYEITFPKDRFAELLAISSLNGNGFVREKAVNKLYQLGESRAIQFLIYRLADWVKPVRQAAIQGLGNYKSIGFIDDLVENLPIFKWLQEVERTDLSSVYFDIIDFIIKTNREYVLQHFERYPDKLRLLLANHLSSSLSDDYQELMKFIEDKHFLVRSLALNHFEKLSSNEIERLLEDKSANVRLQALYKLNNSDDFKRIISEFIADSSATIRCFARFALKGTITDFGEIYYQNLINNKNVIGSLVGLAEVDAKKYSVSVEKFLTNKNIKVRKTAFLALRKLDEETAYQFALSNLDSNYVGIRNAAIDFLATMPRIEVLEKARQCYNSGNSEIRKAMLKLFNKIGGWPAFPELMIGTLDKGLEISQLSFDYLQIWKAKAIRLFTKPGKDDFERAKQIFSFAHEMHEDKKYFNTNPLDGLGFYFK
jgi:HEAT repeat protein